MSSFLKNPTVQIVAGYFPKVSTIVLAVVCFALGMIWAYGIQPVRYVNGDPSQLEQSFQDQWVLGAAARYTARNFDGEAAALTQALLERVDDPAGIVNELRNTPELANEAVWLNDPQFDQILQAAQPNAAVAPPQPGILNNFVVPIVVLVVFAILVVLGKVLWTLLIFPFIEPLIARGRDTSDSQEEIRRIKEQRAMEAEMKSATVDTSRYGEPIIRKASLFRSGFGNYDDSFNIETEDKTYYGEAGATISEKIDDDGVTALEVWMFDKDEFANTPTAIFASEYAFNDPTIRSRLEPKGEVILMETGNKAILETDGIYVEAIVRDVNYDESAPIPKSVIIDSTVQIIAWAKSGSSAPAPGGATAPAMPQMPDMPAAPPPAQPQQPSQPQQPLAPPPLNPDALSGFGQGQGNAQPPPPMGRPGGNDPFAPPPPPASGSGDRPPEDDPFGGAGDFTPVNPNR